MIEKPENKIEGELNVVWKRPDISRERGEIERVVQGFLGLELNEENMRKIAKILNEASMVELSEEDWESLENTDSFHNIRQGHLEDVEAKINEYNQELDPELKRNYEKHLYRFRNGIAMECPTIVKKDGVLHLVSGNTRLMFSRALGVRPKVVIGEYKQ